MKKPARFGRISRRRQLRSGKEKRGFWGRIAKFTIPLILVVAVIVWSLLGRRYWTGKDKVGITYRTENGDAAVVILDPTYPEITRFIISGDTEVNVARGYGTLRIKNVWQLGINEKLNGELLRLTVVKNFLFPVNLWSDEDADCLVDPGVVCLANFIFRPGATNIPFWDRTASAMFSLKVKDVDKTTINLVESQYLKKQTLGDGEKGYKLPGTTPQRLTVYFVEPAISSAEVRIHIIDGTGTAGIAQNIGQILEVIGGKVVSLDRTQEDLVFGCRVLGRNKLAVKRVVGLLGCDQEKGEGEYDLEVKLGKHFPKEF